MLRRAIVYTGKAGGATLEQVMEKRKVMHGEQAGDLVPDLPTAIVGPCA
jgi:hypothetical protein